jgi:hypothetical protein
MFPRTRETETVAAGQVLRILFDRGQADGTLGPFLLGLHVLLDDHIHVGLLCYTICYMLSKIFAFAFVFWPMRFL